MCMGSRMRALSLMSERLIRYLPVQCCDSVLLLFCVCLQLVDKLIVMGLPHAGVSMVNTTMAQRKRQLYILLFQVRLGGSTGHGTLWQYVHHV